MFFKCFFYFLSKLFAIIVQIAANIKCIFTKYGFIGSLTALIITYGLYRLAVNKWNTVEILYPSFIKQDVLPKFLEENLPEKMPDENHKIYTKNLSKDVIIEPGHSFGYALYHLAMPNFQVEKIVELLKKNTDLRKIKPGHKISVQYDCATEYFIDKKFARYAKQNTVNLRHELFPMEQNDICLLRKMSMALSHEQKVIISAINDYEFNIQVHKINTVKKTRFTKGVIENSLYYDAVKAGTPPGIIQAMIQEYSFDVDFQRDIHQGDTFVFVFDELFDENGEKIRNGTFKYGNLTLSNKSHKVYYFDGQFYNEKAESVKRALMKTPIDGARISSGFSNARKHPVLGYTRKHQGVDFAAPIGTPIYAAADGVVTFVGVKSGYGNFIMVKHNTEYGTNYAHLSKFKSGLHKGQRVKQREVIGYVGMTGLASGPHLHFEVEKNGVKINPSSQKFASITKLTGAIRDKFEDYRRSIKDYLAKNDND